MPSRQDQSRVTVVVDGRNCGVWDDRTGGDADSNTTQYQLGGMGPRISLGGPTQVANVVVNRLEDDELMGLAKFLYAAQHRNAPVACTQQKLDDEGNPIYEPFQWTGKVKRFKLADVQSQSNSASQAELELEVDGLVA